MSVPDTPYTRDEMYLSAIADGDSSGIPDRPYTRKEKYLDAIATGDSSGIPDTPYTREEMYLDAIAKNGGGGGGGGSTLINKSVSANGTYNASDDNADGYKKVTVNVQPDLQSKSVTITENGNSTVQPDSGKDGLSSVAVTVNVPNSYAAGDEGKVVSNGELVAQTAHAEVTQNGTIDTTLNNSVTVNVPGGTILHSGTITPANKARTISFDCGIANPTMILIVPKETPFTESGVVVAGGWYSQDTYFKYMMTKTSQSGTTLNGASYGSTGQKFTMSGTTVTLDTTNTAVYFDTITYQWYAW